MHEILVFSAFGWLALGGLLHFIIDVVSQYLRGKRVVGPETTLYYGLNTAYALGQFMFGVFGILFALQVPNLLSHWPAVTLSLAATMCWLAVSFVFLEYREPRFVIGIFGILVIAAAVIA